MRRTALKDTYIDVLLLCALKDEYDQVLSVTDGLSANGWVETNSQSGRSVADATFTTTDGREIIVRATWMAHMTREQAQSVTSAEISVTPAKCIAMSGICAGRRGETNLGDVIFADRLWSYDVGKLVVEDGDNKFKGDMLQYRPKEIWVQQMQRVEFSPKTDWIETRPKLPLESQEDWTLLQLLLGENPTEHTDFNIACPDWPKVLKRLWDKGWVVKPTRLSDSGKAHIEELLLLHPHGLPEPEAFAIHVAPMATGDKVVEDTGIFPRLSTSMRKVLGVDMEASGLAALGEAHGIPVVVAKGVSDFGDTFKDDRYRHFAARASAEAMIAFLRQSSHLYLSKKHELGAASPISANIERVAAGNTVHPRALINTLAELYPEVAQVRVLWERAGGRASDIEDIRRPRDLWQRVWKSSIQGAAVSPAGLLEEVLSDYPDNHEVNEHLRQINNASE